MTSTPIQPGDWVQYGTTEPWQVQDITNDGHLIGPDAIWNPAHATKLPGRPIKSASEIQENRTYYVAYVNRWLKADHYGDLRQADTYCLTYPLAASILRQKGPIYELPEPNSCQTCQGTCACGECYQQCTGRNDNQGEN